jgi:iron-sulfur cluster insertion protein
MYNIVKKIQRRFMGETLIFTANAASKVWELIQEEGNFNLKLRVYVTGGGCSGFQYGFKFDEVVNDDDTVVTQIVEEEEGGSKEGGSKEGGREEGGSKEGEEEEGGRKEGGEEGAGTKFHSVQLLVDPMSYSYLAGAEIDYKEDIEGAQFIIRNPNAKTTCGCGSSFSA